MPELIRVIIVDDHPVFRYGLRSLLAQDQSISLVGEADSAASALVQIENHNPEIVLLDVRMSGLDGISLAQRLRSTHPEIKVIILTAYENEDYLLEALGAGVYAYLLKDASYEILSDAIHKVHAGQKLLDAKQTNVALQQLELLAQARYRDQSQLTDLELEVMKCMAAGDNYQVIGAALFMSEVTVKRTVSTILAKLAARNRTQAVAEAIRRGLI